jgi:thermitase
MEDDMFDDRKAHNSYYRHEMKAIRLLGSFAGTLSACAVLLACVDELAAADSDRRNPELSEKKKTLPFAAGEVLFAVKEGGDPQSVLKDLGVKFKSLRRVHSTKPAVAKVRKALKEAKLEKDSAGRFSFRGKRYHAVNEIADEELFQEALKSMSRREKALYRDCKVTFSRDADAQEAIARLKKNPDVEYAQENYRNQLHGVPLPAVSYIPNDYYLADDLNPGFWREQSWTQTYPDLWGLQKIQAVEAWNEFANPAAGPGSNVLVAVIDTGVWQEHPDLTANVFHNDNDPPGDADGDGDPDDDGNGLIDDTDGWDFSGDNDVGDPNLVEPDNDPYDDGGHGSHCAGTIAAAGNNGAGIVGVAPNAKILSVKIFPNAYDDIAAEAIRYAADFAEGGRRVIMSCSWGPGSRVPSKPVLERAIDYAVDEKGCLVVFSAGNANDDVAYYSPANYSKSIAVAASDHNDERSIWGTGSSASNFGELIDVAAPGGGDPTWASQNSNKTKDILSTMSDDSERAHSYPQQQVSSDYYRLGGTSMACPHVSGLAALIWSQNPALTNTEVKNILYTSCDDVGLPGKDEDSGWGRINAYKAMRQQPMPIIEIISLSPRRVFLAATGQVFTLSIAIKNNWLEATNVAACLTISDERFAVLGGSNYFGSLANGQTKSNADSPFTVSALAEITTIEKIPISFVITADGGYQKSQTLDLLLFPGNIQSRPWVSLDNFWHCFVMNRAVGDLDGDGTNELVASAGHPATSWTLGPWNAFDLFVFNHDGSVRPGWPVHLEMTETDIYEAGAHPTLSDLDGDGKLEIIISVRPSSMAWNVNRRNQLHVYRSDGSPYPGWPVEFGSPGDEIYVELDPVVVDLDQQPDGHKEIIVNVFQGDPENWELFQAKCYAFSHDGNFLSGWPYVFQGTIGSDDQRNFTIPAVGNVGGDPYPEVITASKTGKVHILGRNGQLKRLIDTQADGTLYRIPFITLANLDADAEDEMILCFAGTKVYAYNGDGTVVPGWPVSADNTETFEHFVLGDVNGDRALEIVALTCPSAPANQFKLYLFETNGTRLQAAVSIPGYGYSNPMPAIGDANGDGTNDVVYWVRDNTFEEYSKICAVDYHGDMLPGFPRLLAHYFPYGNSPTLSDFDQDGTLDVIVSFMGTLDNAQRGGSIYVLPLARQVAPLEWPMFQHDTEYTGRYTVPPLIGWMNEPRNTVVTPGSVVTMPARAHNFTGGPALFYDCAWYLNDVLQAGLPTGATFTIGQDRMTRLTWNVSPGINPSDVNKFEFRVWGDLFDSPKLTKTVQIIITPP